MSIRSITWWASSLATIVRPSGAMNASSAEKRWPLGRLPATGNRHRTCFASSTIRSRPLPRSAISKPSPNRPAADGGIDGAAETAGDGGTDSAAPTDPEGLPAVAATVGDTDSDSFGLLGDAGAGPNTRSPSVAMTVVAMTQESIGRADALPRCAIDGRRGVIAHAAHETTPSVADSGRAKPRARAACSASRAHLCLPNLNIT